MNIKSIFSNLFHHNNDLFKSVGVVQFANYIDDTNVVLLDVRSQVEVAEAKIEGCLHIDILKDDFMENVLSQIPKERPVAVYCKTGRRSKTAARMLTQKGYQVVDLNPGIVGWIKAGKPTISE